MAKKHNNISSKDNQIRKNPRGINNNIPRGERNPGRPSLEEAVAKAVNDVSWYAQNPELLMDSASISYNTAVGTPLHLMEYAAGPNSPLSWTNYYAIPGIYTMRVAPIPGYTIDNSSPINIAARNLYSFVRYVNSGHANYDPVDLMIYVLAMDSLYSFVAWLRRIYGELQLTSQYNRYLPEQQVRCEGLDYDDLVRHIVDLRAFINTFQLKLGTFVIPDRKSVV